MKLPFEREQRSKIDLALLFVVTGSAPLFAHRWVFTLRFPIRLCYLTFSLNIYIAYICFLDQILLHKHILFTYVQYFIGAALNLYVFKQINVYKVAHANFYNNSGS